MLLISLSEGDYVMIGGNIKVSYDHIKGKNSLVLGIEAPKDVDILRGEFYEKELEKMIAEGNEEAGNILARLKKEHEARRKKSAIRQKRQRENA